jgi:hypothetical protein
MLMKSALFFLYITQRWVVILYRRFGTTYRSHLQGQELKEVQEGKDSLEFLNFEDGIDTFSRNVGKGLLLNTV